MNIIFDGKEFAKKKEKLLCSRVAKMAMKPKLVSFIIGNDPASVLYQNLKKKAAEKIGAGVDILLKDKTEKVQEIIKLIEKLNEDGEVHGIMVQLPLPEYFSEADRDEIINAISPEKDVDGLLPNSKYTPPTAKAVIQILAEALKTTKPPLKDGCCKVAVIGATGFIGRQIVRTLKRDYKSIGISDLKVEEVNSKTPNSKFVIQDSDVVISVTGVPGLIKADMVKNGAILIDVGAPKGDIEKSAYEKATFATPVPGGVGPVTINCLMENLVEAASGSQ